jgi:arylsulfatase A-like enzyme
MTPKTNTKARFINRRNFLKLTASAALTASALPHDLVAKSFSKKLNFVFILIDDMGWTDTGCYGTTFYQTPNIDRLAAQGMRFTNAYAACPVCSPTRASILTGKYPARLNLTDWIPGRQSNGPRPDEKLIGPRFAQQMELKEFTLAEALKEAGYTTAFIGKWHLGDEMYYPEYQGFDINIGGISYGWPIGGYFSPYKNPKLKDGPKGQYLTDRLTDEALKFLDENNGRPFLLYLSHYAVHTPLESKKDLTEKYQAKADKLPPQQARFVPEGDIETRQIQDHAVYAGMVQSVDESVGRIMEKLDRLGLAENTCIIFMSDNGGLSTAEGSPTSNLPLRAGKGWLYEGGIREPMIIKWPGVVKPASGELAEPASLCHEPVISNDFYPTILEMAGLKLLPEQHVDGVSLVPLLRQSAKLDRKALYWHYPHYSNQGGKPSGAVRCGDYKLIEFYEDQRVELYNLKDDIGEKNNLAEQLPEKTAEMQKMLHDWRNLVNAHMPEPNPNYPLLARPRPSRRDEAGRHSAESKTIKNQ